MYSQTKWLKALKNYTGHFENTFCFEFARVSQCVSSELFSGLNDLCSQVVRISWDQQ